ncbi:E3 ubiquitin-protein ligase ZNRF2 isoform X2 [Sipha flava]|uniref:RING-type E3 ubiquitin transferase n=1 Tax=Sipha flava TaxID=143950 RepID=A0A8B8G143_9HEMI|nr:E3 ubiquitin-protein ligase ZNRF2 isoform X2 [Sipha flava]
MGAKASTANGDDSGTSHGDRSFASGNGSDSVHTAGNPGFSILRSLPSAVANDRQRARSLSSVPDGHDGNSNSASPRFDITDVLEADSSSNDDQILDSPTVTANISLGRVYSAHSLPAHIWPFNGIKCPVCSKFVLPDEIEVHLVMCLTKPRLIYNEDVLKDDKGECVICLEELIQGDTIARLPCLCIYHKTVDCYN